MDSTSSIKIIEGALRLAVWKRSRIRAEPTPTNISINSDPAIEKQGTPASPAKARAKSVFPTPGGPKSKTPLGVRAPKARYFPGFFKKSTTSESSCLASSTPATSLKVMRGVSLEKSLARDWPKEKIDSCAPRAWRKRKRKKRIIKRRGRKLLKRESQIRPLEVSLTSNCTVAGSITFKRSLPSSFR